MSNSPGNPATCQQKKISAKFQKRVDDVYGTVSRFTCKLQMSLASSVHPNQYNKREQRVK